MGDGSAFLTIRRVHGALPSGGPSLEGVGVVGGTLHRVPSGAVCGARENTHAGAPRQHGTPSGHRRDGVTRTGPARTSPARTGPARPTAPRRPGRWRSPPRPRCARDRGPADPHPSAGPRRGREPQSDADLRVGRLPVGAGTGEVGHPRGDAPFGSLARHGYPGRRQRLCDQSARAQDLHDEEVHDRDWCGHDRPRRHEPPDVDLAIGPESSPDAESFTDASAPAGG